MEPSIRRLLILAVLGLSLAASAFEEAVRRQEVDGGVHVPVLTKAPQLLHFVEAAYPPDAQKEGRTASVSLVITLAADGTVSEASIPQPVGGGFDEAAQAAVMQFVFSPAEVDHQPASVQIEYVYHFTLAPPPEAVAEPAAEPLATLKGQLIARGSRTRIPSATVRCGVEADAPETMSDEQGNFELRFPAGECQLKVVANNFELYQTTETLAAGELAEVVYHLWPTAIGYETVVRGSREKKEVVRRTLERQELQKIPGSFGDPVRVLQNFPGVARAPFISGELVVRGASPDQTLTFLDGVEIPILYHLGGGPSVVNGEFLDRIDFFPGGFGARYGRAVGGIVDVSTRKGASDTFHGSVKVDLQDTAVFLETPVTQGVSVAAAVRRSYVDALIPLVLPQDPEGGSLLILPVYWDYQVRMDIGKRADGAPASGSTFSLMAFGSDDLLKLVATGGGRNRDLTVDVHTHFHRLVGNWTYRKGRATFGLTPYLGYDLGGAAFGTSTFRVNQYEVGVREDLAVELNPNLTLRVGADLKLDHIVGGAELPVISGTQYPAFPGAEPQAEMQKIDRELQSFDGALFMEADLRAGALTLTPGIRASSAYVHGQSRWAAEPRLWVRYQLTPTTSVKSSVGLYSQPPNPEDMDAPPLGNPKLTHEWAFQTAIGAEHQFTDALNLDLTLFYNRRFENVGSPGATLQNDDGSITRERFSNNLLGRAYGLEAMLRHDVTKNFFGWVAYTLNRSESRRAGGPDYELTSYDQTHILTAVGSYRLPYGFELGARFRYVTGRPTTPLIHDYDLYNADSNRFVATRGDFRSTRLRDFQQLDLRLDKSFLFESWTLTAYLDVQNVYNATNVEATLTDYRFREEIEVPGIPILPIVGVKGSF